MHLKRNKHDFIYIYLFWYFIVFNRAAAAKLYILEIHFLIKSARERRKLNGTCESERRERDVCSLRWQSLSLLRCAFSQLVGQCSNARRGCISTFAAQLRGRPSHLPYEKCVDFSHLPNLRGSPAASFFALLLTLHRWWVTNTIIVRRERITKPSMSPQCKLVARCKAARHRSVT